jgi:glyoxylase-like metal-dependent hydrolase (beta-lactamase superfamily II)
MNRRQFIQLVGSAGPTLALPSLLQSEELSNVQARKTSGAFKTASRHVLIHRDVINVSVIVQDGKCILINSGDGSILDALKLLGLPLPEWALYTDHRLEHCASAGELKARGVKIAVPVSEAEFFLAAREFWLSADRLIDHRYDFRPDLSVLRASVQPNQLLDIGSVFKWRGLELEVIATPGFSDGGVSYIINIDGQRLAFTGNLLTGSGQLSNIYELQKPFPGMRGNLVAGHGGYWGFGGGLLDVKRSLSDVLAKHPTMLIPSHGVLIENPAASVSLLRTNIDEAMENYLTLAAWRIYFKDQKVLTGFTDVPMLPSADAPTMPSWLRRVQERPLSPDFPLLMTSWYIQADDGSIFLFDCGYSPVAAALNDLVHGGKIKGIDGVWISHYHDDHVSSVNEIRRMYQCRVYAQREIQDILENPTAYEMPCIFPESILVDHPLSEGEVIEWKGYKMTAFYFPGQTLYHGGLLVEHDGDRLFLSGDSFANFGIDDYCAYNRNFLGTEEPGYRKCIDLLFSLKPDMLIAAHHGPVAFIPDSLSKAAALLEQRKALYAKLFPWDDPNFGLDPTWVRAYPFRQKVMPGQIVTIEARIFNHSASAKSASAGLHTLTGWGASSVNQTTIPAHAEGAIRLPARAPTYPAHSRDVLGLAVHFDGKDLGEAAVAIVDFLR